MIITILLESILKHIHTMLFFFVMIIGEHKQLYIEIKKLDI